MRRVLLSLVALGGLSLLAAPASAADHSPFQLLGTPAVTTGVDSTTSAAQVQTVAYRPYYNGYYRGGYDYNRGYYNGYRPYGSYYRGGYGNGYYNRPYYGGGYYRGGYGYPGYYNRGGVGIGFGFY